MEKENFSLTYFISATLFFGTIYSQIFNLSGSDSIFAGFIGTIIGIIIIILIHKMNFELSFFRLIQIIIYLFFIVFSLTTIETYVSSFLLTKTPKILIIIPAVLICLYASFKDIKTLRRASFIFICLSITSFAIIISMLSSYFCFNNLLPFFTTKMSNILKASLTFGILSAFPNIILKEENIKLSKHILYYIITTIFYMIICTFTLATLTPEVAKIYSFPEYMVLKRIKFFGFIENVENLSALVWYFNYFYFLALTFKRINNIIKNKTAFITLIILTALFTTFFIANNYIRALYLYHNVLLYMIFFLFIMSFSIFLKSNVKHK